jgi:uncharacterized glyoxalase superfamily protein PhnB
MALGLTLVVSDIEGARAELLAGGVEASEVENVDWGDFVYFTDPDGNAWAVQASPGGKAEDELGDHDWDIELGAVADAL